MTNIEEVTFGVEFETVIPRGSISVGGYHCGTPVTQAPQFDGRPWLAERDGSINAGIGKACEFVSPVLKASRGVEHLIEFLTWLRGLGATVNSSCGLHIHVGVAGYQQSDEQVTDFVNRLAHVASFYSTALYAQTGTISRENGHFCAKPGSQYRAAVKSAKKTKSTFELRCNGRYQMLNLTNVARNRTIEFRCFAGTINQSKVLVHLFSVLTICRIASQLSCIPNWESKVKTGQEAVWNLLSRQMHRRAACQTFADNWPSMVKIAIEMAEKYDAAKAAQLH